MKLETMQALVKRAHEALPAAAAREILLAAALMAEAAEGAMEAKPSPPLARPGSTKVRTLDGLLVTKRTLRERGLEYASVAECAHDLIEVKKMSRAEAAKRMGCDLGRVHAALGNYRTRFAAKGTNGARASS